MNYSIILATFRTSQCQDSDEILKCYEGRYQGIKRRFQNLNTRKRTSRTILTGILSKNSENSEVKPKFCIPWGIILGFVFVWFIGIYHCVFVNLVVLVVKYYSFSCKFSDCLFFLLISIVIILVKAFFYWCKSFTFSADLRSFKPPALVVLMSFSRVCDM